MFRNNTKVVSIFGKIEKRYSRISTYKLIDSLYRGLIKKIREIFEKFHPSHIGLCNVTAKSYKFQVPVPTSYIVQT